MPRLKAEDKDSIIQNTDVVNSHWSGCHLIALIKDRVDWFRRDCWSASHLEEIQPRKWSGSSALLLIISKCPLSGKECCNWRRSSWLFSVDGRIPGVHAADTIYRLQEVSSQPIPAIDKKPVRVMKHQFRRQQMIERKHHLNASK